MMRTAWGHGRIAAAAHRVKPLETALQAIPVTDQ
jgi:hypothetical protein